MNRCDNCVNFNAEDRYLKIPRCNLYGFPLAPSTADTPQERERFFVRIGTDCSGFESTATAPFGKSAPTQVPPPSVGISLNAKPAQDAAATRVAVPSCGQCQWFIPGGVVLDEFGFHTGMCSAKAELIPSSQMAKIASVCEIGNKGPNRTSTDGVLLNDRYDLQAGVNVAAARAAKKHEGFDPFAHTRVDPREWESELPVTEDEAEYGIKAWRLVHDPKGNRPPIPMPIFDWEAIGLERDPRDTYGDHKPHLYVDHAGLLYTMAFMTMGGMKDGVPALNRPLALIGEAGTGKTEAWCYFAWLMDVPFHRISLRPDTESEEFFGKTALVVNDEGEQVTQFIPGRFTRAYQEPGVILLDELNAAPENIMFLLRPALDSSGQLVLEAEDQIIERHPLCFTGIAMNPSWNPSYSGTRPLSSADSDRLAKRWVDLPDDQTERSIIRKHCQALGYNVEDHILGKLMNIAGELRGMYREHAITTPWGIRPQVAVAQYTWGFDLEDAFRLAVLDEMEPEAAEVILGVVRAHA